jgi:hypothetical protein
MPKKKLYLQISFEQGMVDTVVSDYDYQDSDLKWQAPQSRSAVFIKNYDPAIVKGALTKRAGYGFLREIGEQTNIDMGLVDWRRQTTPTIKGIPNDFVASTSINVDLGRFTDLVDQEQHPFNQLGTGYQDPYVICGATSVAYNKPLSQQVLVYFTRYVTGSSPNQAERTRIVHYGFHLSGANSLPRWYNPHTNGGLGGSDHANGSVRTGTLPHPYPGWDVYGTFTDAAKHGGTLVFTTDVATNTYPWANGVISGTTFAWTNPFVINMYPCYVWTYWDIRRKRNDNRKFWNIINENPVGSVPLSDLTPNYDANHKYSHFKVLTPSLKLTRDTNFVSWKAYQATDVISAAVVDSRIISGFPAGDVNDVLSAQAFGALPINSAVEVAIIEFRGRRYNANAVTASGLTPNDIPTDRLTVVKEYPWLNEYSEHINTIEILNTNPTWPTVVASEYWKLHNPVTQTLENITILDAEIGIGQANKRRGKVIAATMTGTTRDVRIANGKIGDDFKEIKDSSYWTVGISLPNYLAANAPRPWMQGEEIPLCLTATIRGAEVVVATHTHIVQMTDYKGYPSMWWPAYYYETVLGQNGGGVTPTDDWSEAPSGNPAYGCFINKEVISEAFYLSYDGLIRINGRAVYIAPVRGYSYRPFGWTAGNDIHYAIYKNFKPWCIEPFNPTANHPHVVEENENLAAPFTDAYTRQLIYHRATDFDFTNIVAGQPYSSDNNASGYRKEHTSPKTIAITLKIDSNRLGELLELGIESLNVYCAQPGENSLFNSVGLYSLTDPTPGIYMLPDKPEADDYTKYRLVKKFIIDGDGAPFNNFGKPADNTYWKKYYTGQPVATNSWVLNQFGTLTATGQQKKTDLSDPLNPITALQATQRLTPDFILWDYPISQTLSLNSSGNYWEGRGAKLVCNIKGRTFLGGCIDKYGEEEQAVIRYSDVQSGVITLDVFSEESQLRVGGLPHTAFAEYREHIWIFNKQECHRIQMPDVVDITSWEYLDKIPGQGTFNNKTVITTPYGVVWANEGGVWLSDGRMPENLAEQVLTFYKAMSTNAPPYYSTKVNFPLFPYDEFGQNPYMEVAYDEFKNELVVCSPSVIYVGVTDYRPEDHQQLNEEWRLVYSFASKVWHVQHADLPGFNNYLNEFDRDGKASF